MVVSGQSVNVRNPLTSRWEAGKVTDALPHRSIEVNLEKGSHDIRESSVFWQPAATILSPVKTREETRSSPTHEPEIRTAPDS